MGVDAVEPDVVFTKDAVAVVRHENEISGTTDVADRPEFAHRRTTKPVDGVPQTGWFTEDFTWAELSTLRCRERLPHLRRGSAAFDDTEPPLRLRDLLDLVAAASHQQGRDIGIVLEIKHATYFGSRGSMSRRSSPRNCAPRGGRRSALAVRGVVRARRAARLRARGIRGTYVYLVEADGAPFDLVAAHGAAATPYRDQVSADGLARLAARWTASASTRRCC
jgi:glycerophosphoryl diester phosphodiesterase